VPAQGLDEEKLAVLLRWGEGLQADPRAEVAAAGRAILLLIEEIERLHVLLWDKRLFPDVPVEAPEPAPRAEPERPAHMLGPLMRRLRHRGGDFPQPDLSPGDASHR
jgi:hypothetical protein